jgi:hypothetical protein
LQIRFFLLQNRQGKTRLSKWYSTPPTDSERVKMEADVNRVISSRTKGHTNFVEVTLLFSCVFRVMHCSTVLKPLW